MHVSSASLHTVAPTQGEPACAAHAPPSHESGPLQKRPSSQLAALFVCVQTPSSHASSVQGLPSSQSPQPAPASAGVLASGAPASGSEVPGSTRQPRLVWQNIPSAQVVPSDAAKHAPSTQTACAQPAGAGQSAFRVHSRAQPGSSPVTHSGGTQRRPAHSVAVGSSPGPGHIAPTQLRAITTWTAVVPLTLWSTRRATTTSLVRSSSSTVICTIPAGTASSATRTPPS